VCDAGNSSSLVQLSSNPQNLSNIRPGDTVVFTCRTTSSAIQQWSSIHYVGDGGRLLSFAEDNMAGREERTPNNVSVATLTMVDDISLESELRITVSAGYPTSNVTCINEAQQVSATICFSVGKRTQIVILMYVVYQFLIFHSDYVFFLCEHDMRNDYAFPQIYK
jgi:hypothetical protein